MGLMYWWLLLVMIGVIIAAIIIKLRHRAQSNKKPDPNKLPIAHARYFTELPLYRSLLTRYRWLLLLFTVVLICGMTAGLLLSGRLVGVTTDEPGQRSRDIMLCLDVSGSMTEDDAKVVEKFQDLVQHFNGERIGMTIFDSSSASVFPLTNDYDFVKDKLAAVEKAFTSDDYSNVGEIFNGTTEGEGSSLIGDGLTSCVMRFDSSDTKRSKSIILATDNGLAGMPIVTLKQAGGFAKQKGVRVYGLNPGDFSTDTWTDETADEYRQVMLATGGAYYKFDDASAISGIIDQISRQEATQYKAAPQLIQQDIPLVPAIILFIAVASVFVLAWRLDS